MTINRASGTPIALQAGFAAAGQLDCKGFRTGRKSAVDPRKARYREAII